MFSEIILFIWIFSLFVQEFNQVNDTPYSRSNLSEVLLRKGVLKICNKFTGEHPCYIFSEHLFLRTPLEGCFYYSKDIF